MGCIGKKFVAPRLVTIPRYNKSVLISYANENGQIALMLRAKERSEVLRIIK